MVEHAGQFDNPPQLHLAHPPRTCGVCNARSRWVVAVARVCSCSRICELELARSFSTSSSFVLTWLSVSSNGLTSPSIERCRWSRSTTACFWNSLSDALASWRND